MNLSQPYKYYVQPSKVGGGQLNFAIFLGAMDVHVGADIRRAPPPRFRDAHSWLLKSAFRYAYIWVESGEI